MAIIGTAGHVDHGKSTLVQALTGRDPDRWAEEKARGLTIDLGFAWAKIGEHVVGFVDVPGHERFIKNMLAGVGALTVGLFVVAADEGWMPQTEEHLGVLDLIGIQHGVIALTKVDVADPDVAELAAIEVAERVEGTSLADWPIVRVSAVSGEGIDALRVELARALTAAGPPRNIGRARLWIDRSFSIAGAGVVVTGTLIDGSLTAGDDLDLVPGGVRVRIRGLQSHEEERTTVAPGTRTAINLSGADRDQTVRGTMLTSVATVPTTRALLAWLRPVRGLDEPLAARGAYQAHLGTGAWPVRIRMIGGPDEHGSSAALVRWEGDIPVVMGDRFILRDTGRRTVVAGGIVLDPAPPSLHTDDLHASVAALRDSLAGDQDARATALLAVRSIAAIETLDKLSEGGTAAAEIRTGRWVATAAAAGRALETIETRLTRFHAANPLRPGEPKATIASSLSLEPELLEAIVDSSAEVVDDGSTLRLFAFRGGWGQRQDDEWADARDALLEDGLAVRRTSQLDLGAETLHALLRDGRLVKIADDLAYLPEQVDGIIDRLRRMADGFTVAEFRDAMGMSRRQAVPVLEWLDAKGWTSRRGDVRTVRQRPGPTPDDAPSR